MTDLYQANTSGGSRCPGCVTCKPDVRHTG
jgi:hypothetical protein